jgi:hypothetical protein
MDGGTASTEYDVPYHGSVKFVCPSNFLDSQNILNKNMYRKDKLKQWKQKKMGKQRK